METLFYALGLSLLGGLISLDQTAVLQSMVSQPLPACFLLGTAAGHLREGIAMGVAFQILFVTDLPIGSHLPKNATLMSMGALGAALVYGREAGGGPGSLALAALLAVAAEPLIAAPGRLVRSLNHRLTPPVRRRLEEGRTAGALLLAQAGLILFLLEGFTALFLFMLAGGWVLSRFAGLLPGAMVTAARWSFALFPIFGAARFLSLLNTPLLSRLNPIALLHLGRKEP